MKLSHKIPLQDVEVALVAEAVPPATAAAVLREREVPQQQLVPGEQLAQCSFGTTGTHYALQTYYRCRTCGLTGGEGVCEACAHACHRGHDLSPPIYGNFFCDCGAGSGPQTCCLIRARPAEGPRNESDCTQVVRINYVPSASNIRSRHRRLSIQDKNLVSAAPPESNPADEAPWGYRIKVVPVALCRRGHLAVATSKRFCDEFAKLVAVMGTWRAHEDEGLVALVNKLVQE